MASKGSKKDTSFHFTKTQGGAANKYANIYSDLREKEKIYSENTLKKKFKLPEGKEEEKVDPKKLIIRTISSEEARKSAQERKHEAKITRLMAAEKAIPATIYSDASQIESLENLKRLKKEKQAVKAEEKGDEFSFTLDDEDYIKNDPEYIREKAKERATMDKSEVEIYKEYSEFDRPAREKEAISSFEERAKKALSRVQNEEVSKKVEVEVPVEVEAPVEDLKEIEKKVVRERVTEKDEIKSRENEIEQIKKMRARQLQEEKPKKPKKRKREKPTKDIRADVYRDNNKKKSGFKLKRIALIIIILGVVSVFAGALVDRLLVVDVEKPSITKPVEKPKPEPKPTPEPKPEEPKKLTDKEKIRKIEALKPQLNAAEANRVDYITEHLREYPEPLINLLMRNSETVDYVYSYKDREKYNAKKLSNNISSSYYVSGDVPLFLQWDRRWGYRNYGKEMMGLAGCGPTSLAMVIRHFDKNSGINPYDVAKYSYDNGYVSKDNFTSWKLFEKGLRKYNLQSRDVIPVEAKMKRALDDGKVLIVSVNPGTFTERGHLIVIKGYDKKGNFLINDPNSIVNTNKAWTYDELKNDLRKIWAVWPEGEEDTTSYNEQENHVDDKDDSGSSEDPSIIQDID